MFSISDKVVCVNDSFADWCRDAWDHLPKRGVVYVVRGFAPAVRAEDGLLLVGFQTAHKNLNGMESGFKFSRFRKLTDVQAENAAARCANRPA